MDGWRRLQMTTWGWYFQLDPGWVRLMWGVAGAIPSEWRITLQSSDVTTELENHWTWKRQKIWTSWGPYNHSTTGRSAHDLLSLTWNCHVTFSIVDHGDRGFSYIWGAVWAAYRCVQVAGCCGSSCCLVAATMDIPPPAEPKLWSSLADTYKYY